MVKSFKILIVVAVCAVSAVMVYTVFAQQTPSFEVANKPDPTVVQDGTRPVVDPATVHQYANVTFLVHAEDVSGVSSIQAYVNNPSGGTVAVVDLFDDGAHSDGAAGDGVFSGSWNVGTTATGVTYPIVFEGVDRLGHAGNTGGLGTLTIDAMPAGPPIVSITSPVDNSNVYNTVPVTIYAQDDGTVARVELWNSSVGQMIGSRDPNLPLFNDSISWDTSALPIGTPQIIYARAIDNDGNGVNSAPVTVIVNDCVYRGQPDYNESACTIRCGSYAEHQCQHPKFSGEACADGFAYAGFDCSGSTGCCYPAAAPINGGEQISSIPISIVQPDPTVNQINTQTYTVVARVSTGTIDITTVAMDFYLDTSLRDTQFVPTFSDPANGIYEFSSVYALSGFSGVHTIRARVFSRTDPTQYAESSRTVTITIQTPTVSILDPLGGTTINGTYQVVIEASDSNVDGTITRLELYDGNGGGPVATLNPTPANSVLEILPWNTTTELDGSYTIYAMAYDNDNNTAISAFVPITINNAPPSNTNTPINTNTPVNVNKPTNTNKPVNTNSPSANTTVNSPVSNIPV